MKFLLLILFPFCHGVLYTSGQALDECPEYNGHEEFRQFIRFYEYRAGVVGEGLAPEDVMTLVANDNMDNPRWIAPNKPFEHDLDSGKFQNLLSFLVLTVALQHFGNSIKKFNYKVKRTTSNNFPLIYKCNTIMSFNIHW